MTDANKTNDLKQLIQKRGQIKGKLTRFKTYFNNNANLNELLQLKLRLSKFELVFDEFQEVQMQIELLDNADTQLLEREDFENNYFDLITRVQQFLDNSDSSNTHNQDYYQQSAPSPTIKLPIIQLPTFTGVYGEWLPYHDMFCSLIHNNSALSDIQKFHYLKSSLKNEALLVIQSLSISSQNYTVAWKLLKERYQNNKIIIQAHTTALFDLPVLQKENATALRQLSDSFLKNIRALKALNQSVESWLVIHLLTSKFDAATRREWEQENTGDELPTLEDVLAFLSRRCRVLEALESGKHTKSHIETHQQPYKKSLAHVSQEAICTKCKENHAIYKCPEFLKLNIDDRRKEVKILNLCFNCLRSGHRKQECKAGQCKICNQHHNTMLHRQEESKKQEATVPTSVTHHSTTNCFSQILLATAVVNVRDSLGRDHNCRVLLDNGSQSNFITSELTSKLGLKKTSIKLPVTGINQASMQVTSKTTTTIGSRFNKFNSKLEFLIVPRITGELPTIDIPTDSLQIPKELNLADTDYHRSSPIDMLIGAEIFWNLICIGQIKLGKNLPMLQKTKLGWILSGRTSCTNTTAEHNNACHLAVATLENKIERFWQTEEVGTQEDGWSKEERDCEKHFLETVHRNIDGRYTVRLPLKENIQNLESESREIALNRFHNMEKKLQHNEILKKEYHDFMEEYLKMNHMSLNTEASINRDRAYFMPHHAVIKKDSLTTKVRVVFDASAQMQGKSLNNLLLVGPTVQTDLFSLSLRFRTHQIVLNADIEKMYRQITVDEKDRNLQQIYWRFSPQE